MPPPPTAGLTLSVGQASLPVRILIATILAATTIIIGFAGRVIAPRAVLVSILLIEPFAIIGAIAVIFIIAPHSRFGSWLDRFVPRLRQTKVAIVTTIAIGIIAALITVV